ncbi:hypothetical protein ILUMI_20691 [Ignelater luminosus]|uniref:Uncharacterized protein n=1 Tax=Ignelater luminosus TaxID=2038154 RepID=A0A8K0CJ77_IGNLU|nr:hypothetical protein ILUMI_20691 [Ignelater luminosus]
MKRKGRIRKRKKKAVYSVHLPTLSPTKTIFRKKGSARTSISEPDLTTAEKSRFNAGFPPGITVDELFHYRKKKPPAFVQTQDNLRPEEGSFQKITSEYKRRFRDDIYSKIQEVPRAKASRPEDSLKVEGPLELKPEYYESFIEYPIEKSIVRRPKDLINGIGMEVVDEEEKTDEEQEEEDKSTEKQPQFRVGRHYLFKRPTNLKLEGDFYAETENAEKFIHYLLTGRPDLARKPTTLKLEGEMETKTETKEKYVPFEYKSRPPLFKKSTNLHLEGVLDITTETREKYLPYEVQQRPPLIKRSTNLHLEGDLKLQPEYKDVFVEYKEAERPKPKVPSNNLKTEGLFEAQTEKAEKFVEHQIHPVIPFLRGMDVSSRKLMLGDDAAVKRPEYREKFVEHSKFERSLQHKPKLNLRPEGDMEIITENKTQFVQKPVSKTEMRKAANNLLLEGNIDMNPEYRNAYVNFYRDAYGKFGIKKDENEPEKRRRTVSHPATNLKTEGEMETNPEYKSSFVDFPRQRPLVKKPESHLRSEGNCKCSCQHAGMLLLYAVHLFILVSFDHQQFQLSNMTEKRAQYIEYPKGPKAKPLKRQTELKLEGPIESQPEYRRAYIDYITREKVDRLRPPDNLGAQSKRVFDVSENQLQPFRSPSPISKLPVPIAPRKSSLSPVSRASDKKVNKENLSKMENCLFGPKVPNPSSRSRNVSPANETTRLSFEQRARLARARRRYGSPVMVENLAYTPRESPIQAMLQASAKSRWKHEKHEDDTHRDGRAFVVLSNLEEDCNRNSNSSISYRRCDRTPKRHSELYKEQKWMPSWYAPPSK